MREIPQVRFGDWIKTDEGYIPICNVLCMDIEPQGDSNHPDTKNQDAFYVELTLAWQDIWMPDKKKWEKGPKHANYLQMSDYLKVEVYRGRLAECEEVVKQIIDEAEKVLEV